MLVPEFNGFVPVSIEFRSSFAGIYCKNATTGTKVAKYLGIKRKPGFFAGISFAFCADWFTHVGYSRLSQLS